MTDKELLQENMEMAKLTPEQRSIYLTVVRPVFAGAAIDLRAGAASERVRL